VVRILIIEDDAPLAESIARGLGEEGYETVIVGSGEEGFYLVNEQLFDLIVLDILLPGRDGLEVLATLRKRGLRTPVIIITAKDSVNDKVRGLDLGADDYLVKPFSFPELAARIRALLRRGRPDEVLRLKVEDLVMDLISRQVTRGGEVVELTAREFELLEYLMRHHGHIVSRSMLVKDLWDESERATPMDNVIDVHIARLRKKVDRPGRPKLIQTVRGVGFKMAGGEND
jgi:DNA-binding response OmpR family regulator